MKKRMSQILTLGLIMSTLAATGCGNTANDDTTPVPTAASLVSGYWKENCSMGFEIIENGGTFTYVELANVFYRTFDFQGTIQEATDLTTNS